MWRRSTTPFCRAPWLAAFAPHNSGGARSWRWDSDPAWTLVSFRYATVPPSIRATARPTTRPANRNRSAVAVQATDRSSLERLIPLPLSQRLLRVQTLPDELRDRYALTDSWTGTRTAAPDRDCWQSSIRPHSHTHSPSHPLSHSIRCSAMTLDCSGDPLN